MRWFVEISGVGKKPGKSTTLCVEATQWQPALQRARSMRGDDGPLSNFSIELLDDGYRAIDPTTRLKYVVRRAPDDAALTNGADVEVVKSATPSSMPPPKNESVPPPKKESVAPPASVKPPRPESVRPAAPAAIAAAGVDAAAIESVEAKPLIAIPLDKPPAPPPRPGLPSFVVQSKREEKPTARSPLHYREVVYVVQPGTNEGDAALLLRDRLGEVRKSMTSTRTGKLVRLAAFDHAYEGKPERGPLATLTWKDWRGDEPEVKTGSNGLENGHAAMPSVARSAPPPAAPTPSSAPHIAVEETVASSATAALRDAPPPSEAEAPVEVAPAAPPEPPAAAEAPPAEPPAEPPAAATSSPPVSSDSLPAPLPGPKTIIDPPRIEVKEDAPPASFPTPSIVPPTPSYVPPAPVQPAAAQPVPPPVPKPSKKKRLAGDDLLGELFEALSELGFMADALAGAEYVLAVALEKIPSELGLVSFFDINKREFVVVRQMGGPRGVLGFRQPEKAPIALSAMRNKQAVVVTEAEQVARATDARFEAAGVEVKSLVCAPIALGGRYLGLIELANPTDESAYREGDGHALTYVGQQFGEFVAERGVVIDVDHILESAQASAQLSAARRR
ncbi:MAG TPA: GAF domain-containing protein [Minicystis sp.]|nr:GAF domain-containing protein [Minicystis sp.]